MPVSITSDGGVMTARLEGEIDHHSARGLREQIDAALIRQQPGSLRLDFSAVSFMDSSGIGLIMGRHRLLRETGGTVEIINTPAGLKRMMRLAGLGRLGVSGIE